MKAKQASKPSAVLQLFINFVAPLVILTKFSSESQLGPTRGLLLALAFPIFFEVYSVIKTKHFNKLSALAIGGIIVTGAIGLLGLSEGWLAFRRGAPYATAGLVALGAIAFKYPLVEATLSKILDMDKINLIVVQKHTQPQLKSIVKRTVCVLVAILFIAATTSYILTRLIIVHHAGTVNFNQEYARLRVLSLPLITLPLLISLAGSMFYLTNRIEKLTGLNTDNILRRPKPNHHK